MFTPRPFRVDIGDDAIADLRDRLARTRWPHQIADAGWDYGINVPYLRELCEYWRTSYDWSAAQQRLNAHPQFLADVDGVDLHYLHVRGTGPDAFPTRPGSVRRETAPAPG